jgi:hemerythrin
MFEWKPEYSIHLPEIDAQHQRLFVLAGELHSALTKGKGYTVLEKCLSNVVDYTKVHFATEERLMAQYGYPERPAHKAEHDRLTAQVLKLQAAFRGGDSNISLDVLMFLKDWLQHHIGVSDQGFSVYIRGKQAA